MEKTFLDYLNDFLGKGIEGYGVYKSTTWIDKLVAYVPLFLILFFSYLILKKR